MINLLPSRTLIKKCKKILRYYHFQLIKERSGIVRKIRKQALKQLEHQICVLSKERYIEDIVLGIANKKAEIISQIYTYEELGILETCSYPHFDGTKYISSVPEKYFIPEEECIHWANFFSDGQTSRAGSQRYVEVLAMVFPEAEQYELRMMQNNKLKRKNRRQT